MFHSYPGTYYKDYTHYRLSSMHLKYSQYTYFYLNNFCNQHQNQNMIHIFLCRCRMSLFDIWCNFTRSNTRHIRRRFNCTLYIFDCSDSILRECIVSKCYSLNRDRILAIIQYSWYTYHLYQYHRSIDSECIEWLIHKLNNDVLSSSSRIYKNRQHKNQIHILNIDLLNCKSSIEVQNNHKFNIFLYRDSNF